MPIPPLPYGRFGLFTIQTKYNNTPPSRHPLPAAAPTLKLNSDAAHYGWPEEVGAQVRAERGAEDGHQGGF